MNRRLGAAVSCHGDGQLVVVVVHPRHLAPRLGPPFVVRLASGLGDAEPVAERRRAPELEAEQRGKDERAAIAGKAVAQPAIASLHRDLIAAVGRGDEDLTPERDGGGDDEGECGEAQNEKAGRPAHGAFLE